VLIKNSI